MAALFYDQPITLLRGSDLTKIVSLMTTDQGDDFHVRPGRVGSRGTRINPRGNLQSQPFLKQVQVAVRRAGGDPNRIGREAVTVADARKGRAVGSMRADVAQSSSRCFFVRGTTVVGSRT